MKKEAAKRSRKQGGIPAEMSMVLGQLVLPMMIASEAIKKGLLAFVQQIGLLAFRELLDGEAVQIAGPKGKHNASRMHHHWGTAETVLPFGGGPDPAPEQVAPELVLVVVVDGENLGRGRAARGGAARGHRTDARRCGDDCGRWCEKGVQVRPLGRPAHLRLRASHRTVKGTVGVGLVVVPSRRNATMRK
jgi:hypothetical protein